MKLCKNNNKPQMIITKIKIIYKIDIINPVKMVILTEYRGVKFTYSIYHGDRQVTCYIKLFFLKETNFKDENYKDIFMTIKMLEKRNE